MFSRQWWMPDTGGANVPALNDLLSTWGIALSDRVFEGDFEIGDHAGHYASGTSVLKFPSSGLLVAVPLTDQGNHKFNMCVTIYSKLRTESSSPSCFTVEELFL